MSVPEKSLPGRYHGGNKDNVETSGSSGGGGGGGESLTLYQQIPLYVFNVVLLCIAWLFGLWEYSFFTVIGIVCVMFAIWRAKLIQIIEDAVREETLRVHRQRALRQSETAEWFNFIINRWWLFSHDSIFKRLKNELDPVLLKAKPAFVDSIDLHTFHVGSHTPYVKYLRVYEVTDHKHAVPVTADSFLKPPLGLGREVSNYQLVFEGDIGLHSPEFKLVLRIRLGAKLMGVSVDIAVENLNINGKAQIILNMNSQTAFPHITKVSLSFVERPEVWFSVRVLKAVQLMEIPVLKGWIHSILMETLTTELVDPGKLDIRIATEAGFEPEHSYRKWTANGVVTVTVTSGTIQSKLAMLQDDYRWCVLQVNEQKKQTSQVSPLSNWSDSCSFLIDDLATEKIQVKLKGKRMLTAYNLAHFELNLSELNLESKAIVETKLQKKQIKLSLTLEYTPLPSINLDIGLKELPTVPDNQVAGVMYVGVHSGSNLLAMDRTGKSDPYVIVFNNRQKVKTTHYICQTLNPKWEASMEFFVADYTTTTISFLVYDWDGRKITDNDFLGSCNLTLSKDNPWVIRKELALGYGMDGNPVSGNKLGLLCVSAVFRPVPSVAQSEKIAEHLGQGDENMALPLSPKARKNSSKSLVTGKTNRNASVLNMGKGILEITVVRAKDLVAKDRNGYSDPYCEVKVKNSLKFKTSTIKKSLSPVWEESATLVLPDEDDILDVYVWDRDPLFKRDFLGFTSFTLDEIKTHSHAGPMWFTLDNIESGSIQLKFNVITTEDYDGNEGGISPLDDNIFEIDEEEVKGEDGTLDNSGVKNTDTSYDTENNNSTLTPLVRSTSNPTGLKPKTKKSKARDLDCLSGLMVNSNHQTSMHRAPSDSKLIVHRASTASQDSTPKKKKSKLRRVFSMKLFKSDKS